MGSWLKDVIDGVKHEAESGTWPRSDYAVREIARIRREAQRPTAIGRDATESAIFEEHTTSERA